MIRSVGRTDDIVPPGHDADAVPADDSPFPVHVADEVEPAVGIGVGTRPAARGSGFPSRPIGWKLMTALSYGTPFKRTTPDTLT